MAKRAAPGSRGRKAASASASAAAKSGGRELKQDGAETVAQGQHRLDEQGQNVLGRAAQPHVVGDLARRLGAEDEAVGRRLAPASDNVSLGRAIEGGVHLQGVEARGVVGQLLRFGQLIGVERALP